MAFIPSSSILTALAHLRHVHMVSSMALGALRARMLVVGVATLLSQELCVMAGVHRRPESAG